MVSSRFAVTLLIGAPGAGKGTQARFVCEALGVPHIATGDLLREHRKRGTALGITARQYMDRGELVPDGLVVEMVMCRLEEPDAARGALLDGFPRTKAQALALDSELKARGGRVERVLCLDVACDALIDRLSGRRICDGCHGTYNVHLQQLGTTCPDCMGRLIQRPDDNYEVVEHRIAIYRRDTTPVIEHYDARGVLHRIDGDRSIDEIRTDLLATLGSGAVALAAS